MDVNLNTTVGHMTFQIVAGAVRYTVNAFLTDRKSRNLSKNTLAFYTQELELFTRFLDDQGVTMLDDLTPDVIRRYLLDLQARRNGGGCHAAFRAIRALLLWVWEEYELPERNPITRVDPPKKNNQVLPGVPIGDVQRMAEKCQGDLAQRDRAILLTLADTGARAFELCAFTVGDLDTEKRALQIQHGKGNQRRTVYVGKITIRVIRSYLKTRQKLGETSPLFCTDEHDPMTVEGLRRMVERRARQAGVPIPGLHDFRRCFALECMRNGMDLLTVSRLLGHSSLVVTERYLATNDDDLAASHSKHSPVDRM